MPSRSQSPQPRDVPSPRRAERALGQVVDAFRLPGDVRAVLAITVASSFANGAVLPLLGQLRATFDLSFLALGVVTASFAISRTVLDIPGGTIADRYPPRAVFYGAGAAVVTGILLTALAPSYPVLVAGRMLNGGGAVVGSLAASTYVARRIAPHDRGRALGGVVAASLLGGFLSPAIVGAVSAVAGWRLGIGIAVIPAVFALALVRSVVRPDGGDRELDRPARAATSWRAAFFAPRRLWAVNAMAVVVSVTTFGMKSTMVPLYGSEELGLSPFIVGLAVSLAAALGLPLSLVAGAASDRVGRMAIFIPATLFLGVLGLVMNLANSAPVYLLLALGYAVDGSVAAVLRTIVVDRAGPERLGAAIGTSAFFRDVTMSIIPFGLGAVIAVWGFWGVGTAIAVAAALSALMAWRIGDTSPRAVRAASRSI